MRTLVLDQGYMPVNVVDWRRAMSTIARARADVLEEYAAVVHAGVQMPAVVRLNRPVARHELRVKVSRQNVLARDRGRCQYCGRRFPSAELTYDHVTPRAQGGKTTWENIVMACVDCNRTKGNRTPAQAEMRLLRPPARPGWVPRYNTRLQTPEVPPEWRDYWTIELEA
ncbi:MAG TPA: HNH endonuclease [Polyangia bacterium]|jgi:5-methylcytosine-specific restriction endonuclease McrA